MGATEAWLADWQQSMGLAGLAVASFVIGLSGALMPGPLLVLTLHETPRQGPRAALLLMLGHGILESGVVALACWGLMGFLQRPVPFATVALLGSVMIVFMALPMLRTAFSSAPADLAASDTAEGAQPAAGTLRTALSGALVSAANPYWSLWWVTIGASCLTLASRSGWAGPLVFFIGHIAADLAWYWLVARCVWSGRQLLTGRLHRGLLVVCGSLLLLLAVFFATQGVMAGMEAYQGPEEHPRDARSTSCAPRGPSDTPRCAPPPAAL